MALVGSATGVYAAESETFTGAAAASGTYKRPLLIVDGKRYELKASGKADASVAKMLAKFSKGDTGTYAVVGTRGAVNGGDGIFIDRIAPAADSPARPSPTATPPAAAQTAPTLTSKVVTAGTHQYDAYDYMCRMPLRACLPAEDSPAPW